MQTTIDAEWIDFKEVESKGSTKIFQVINKESKFNIGTIKWYGPWRKYCFFPGADTVFESTCMRDITTFLNRLMLAYKAAKQVEKQSRA